MVLGVQRKKISMMLQFAFSAKFWNFAKKWSMWKSPCLWTKSMTKGTMRSTMWRRCWWKRTLRSTICRRRWRKRTLRPTFWSEGWPSLRTKWHGWKDIVVVARIVASLLQRYLVVTDPHVNCCRERDICTSTKIGLNMARMWSQHPYQVKRRYPEGFTEKIPRSGRSAWSS